MKSTKLLRSLALALTLLLALSLGACGGENELSGSWQGHLHITDQMSEKADRELESLLAPLGLEAPPPSMAGYLARLDLACSISFDEDGRYSLSLDEASLLDCADSYRLGIKACLRDYFAGLLMDTLAQSSPAIPAEGIEELEAILGVSLDEAISEALGISLDDYCAKAAADALAPLTGPGAVRQGNYKAEGGKLWLSAGPEYDIDPDVFSIYSLRGERLVIDEFAHGGGAAGLPLSLSRLN